MIPDKHILPFLIMRRLIYFLMKNKDQREPEICPQRAKPKDHVAAFDPAKKTGNDHKGKDQQHQGNKYNLCI